MSDTNSGVVPVEPMPMIMTQREVADFLRVGENTIKYYVQEHDLKTIQVGREKRFKAEDVWDFIQSRPSTERPKRRHKDPA